MPRAYSDDIRLRSIWIRIFVRYGEEEASYTCFSPRTVQRYVQQYVASGSVNVKRTGRPLDLIGMHPREELVMMEAMLSTQR